MLNYSSPDSRAATRLQGQILSFPTDDYHDGLVTSSARETQNKSALERSQQVLADLQSAGSLDLSMLSVALRELRNLA